MSRALWKGIPLAVAMAFAASSACTSLLGSFEVTGGAGGGTGGTGGSTTVVDCSSAECCAPEDCPVTDTECLLRTCTDGTCGTSPAEKGTALSTQTPSDCKTWECDGAGAEVEAPDDTDVLDDLNACTKDTCSAGAPLNTPVSIGTACDQNGGKHCNTFAECVECTDTSHCASNVCGTRGSCLPASCADGVKNGTETDTDCGGECDGCDVGQPCAADGDCYHGVCDPGGLCADPTCSDGVQNGGGYQENNGETDTDCGGPCGASCGPLQMCGGDGDCKGGQCSGALCIPNCFDQAQNNDETDVDCGGSCAGCDNGETCGIAKDCVSGQCVDGVCCDTPCTGECFACTMGIKGAGLDGQCGPVAAGLDPENECDPEAASTCGNVDGTCSGAGGCKKHPLGTACGDSPSCTAGVQKNQDTCSGTGSCTDGGTVGCGQYACGATTCKTTCTSASDCASTAYCDAGTSACLAKKPNGQTCASAGVCQSGFCVDGVCCGSACGGACQACSNAKTGAANGTCASVTANTDPDNECATECNGAGACEAANGTACSQSSQCQSGFCVDGFCCGGACTFSCTACSNAKTGAANGTCANVKANTDPDSECPGTTMCNGNGQCGLLAQGSVCTLAAECSTGFCADGYCCNANCGATCRACSAAKSGGTNGTCTNIPAGTDPDNECATECNGAAACEAANGAACTLNTHCQSGFCADGVCCSSACSGVCKACSAAKTGGADGTCANVTAGTDPDNDCAGASVCIAGGICGP